MCVHLHPRNVLLHIELHHRHTVLQGLHHCHGSQPDISHIRETSGERNILHRSQHTASPHCHRRRTRLLHMVCKTSPQQQHSDQVSSHHRESRHRCPSRPDQRRNHRSSSIEHLSTDQHHSLYTVSMGGHHRQPDRTRTLGTLQRQTRSNGRRRTGYTTLHRWKSMNRQNISSSSSGWPVLRTFQLCRHHTLSMHHCPSRPDQFDT
jgi:hypothetical protein